MYSVCDTLAGGFPHSEISGSIGISVDVFSSGYLDVSVPLVRLPIVTGKQIGRAHV